MKQYKYKSRIYSIVNCKVEDIPSHVERVSSYWPVEILEAQAKSEESKRDLYRRQIEGFDEDYKQKILKICMDSWAVGFSVARDSFEASGIPAPMQKVTIDALYNQFIVTELDSYRDWETDRKSVV